MGLQQIFFKGPQKEGKFPYIKNRSPRSLISLVVVSIVCSFGCLFKAWPSHRSASNPSFSRLTKIIWVLQNLLLLSALPCVSLYWHLITEHVPQRSAWFSADCIILIPNNVVVFWFCLSNQGRRFLGKKNVDLYIEFTKNSEIEEIGESWQAFAFGKCKCCQNLNI